MANTTTLINAEHLGRELDELDRLVHRLRTYLSTPISAQSKQASLQEAWKRTAGILTHERANDMLRYVEHSRQEWEERWKSQLGSAT